MFSKFFKRFCFISALGLLSASCIKDITDDLDDLSTSNDQQHWIFPILKSDIIIPDFNKDNETELKVYADGTVYYTAYLDSAFMIKADSIYTIPNQDTIEHTFNYEGVRMKAFSNSKVLTLQGYFNENPSAASPITSLNGTNSTYPAVTPANYGTHTFPSIDVIDRLAFNAGFLEVQLQNNSDLILSNVTIEFRNTFDNTVVGQANFSTIDSNSTELTNLNLSGKTLRSDLEYEIVSMGFDGATSPIDINTNQALVLSLSDGENISIDEGRAIFNAPFVEYDIMYELKDADGNPLAEELYEIELKSGNLHYEIYSESTTNFVFNGSATNSTSTNGEFKFSESMNSGTVTVTGTNSMAGYTYDLTTNTSQPYNTLAFRIGPAFLGTLQGQIMQNFDSKNLMKIKLYPTDLEFRYLRGKIGQKSFPYDQTVTEWDEDLMSKISGSVDFQETKIHLITKTDIGVDLALKPKGYVLNHAGDLLPMNFDTSGKLDGPEISEEGLVITSQHTYDNTSSNSDSILSHLPTTFASFGECFINPNPSANRECFVYDDGFIQGDLEVEIPLILSADTLFYTDSISYKKEDLEDLKDIDDEKILETISIHLYIDNGLPLGLELSMDLLDSVSADSNTYLTTINYDEVITPAPVDVNGNKTGTSEFESIIELTKAQRIALVNGNKVALKVKAITSQIDGNSPFVKVTKDDHLLMNVSVEVENYIPVE
ncbi:MAG: hypothetical protein ACPG4W_00370 [Flavobacteriales bacterium]